MRSRWLYIFCVVLLLPLWVTGQDARYRVEEGSVRFVSDAPLERIEAHSDDLQGLIDVATREFAFTLPVRSFQGFNSPLQQEHFYENYMDTEHHPKGQFSGRILEEVNLAVPGTYQVRAKGKLAVHGITVERIIPATVTIQQEEMTLIAQFEIPLSDHDISIPRIVRQKIAEDIAVTVEATLTL